jgi:hypothetical protein
MQNIDTELLRLRKTGDKVHTCALERCICPFFMMLSDMTFLTIFTDFPWMHLACREMPLPPPACSIASSAG